MPQETPTNNSNPPTQPAQAESESEQIEPVLFIY